MLRYYDRIELSDITTLKEAEEVEELLRTYGACEREGRNLRFTVTVDGELTTAVAGWNICELLWTIAADLNSRNIPFVPNWDYVEEAK